MQTRLDVLLVDDDHNELALFGLAVDMTDLPIWLQTLVDGEAAIKYLQGHGVYADRSMHPVPDLLVLDLDSRLSRSFDLLDWRKASQAYSSLPVVLLIGTAYHGAVETALAMGAAKVMTKPADFDGWKALVRQIWDFGGKSGQAAA
jgi:CheY-like chemotaxis protein